MKTSLRNSRTPFIEFERSPTDGHTIRRLGLALNTIGEKSRGLLFQALLVACGLQIFSMMCLAAEPEKKPDAASAIVTAKPALKIMPG